MPHIPHFLKMLFIASADLPPPDTPTDYSFSSEFFKMALSLGAVMALLVVLLFLSKKIMRQKFLNQNQSNLIKVLEKRSLSPKSHIYALGVLDRLIIVSETSAGIQPLADFPAGTHLEAAYRIQKKSN